MGARTLRQTGTPKMDLARSEMQIARFCGWEFPRTKDFEVERGAICIEDKF
jgi:hypothetical protein